jgi:mono/diheme cytochrome c family protein
MKGNLEFIYNAVTATTGFYTPLLSMVTYTTAGWKPQMLKCNACHTDDRGALRNPGPFTADYDYYTHSKPISGPVTSVYAKGVKNTYPDKAGSNICIACHTGRESGETLKAFNKPQQLLTGETTLFDFSNKGLVNTHVLTGGATVFTASGYEYANRSYANNAGYRHDNIGTPAEPNTGTNGPCVGCHMSRPNKNGNHLFLPISRAYVNPAGPAVGKEAATITGITSEVCFKCHGPNDTVFLDMVKEQKVLFAEALEALAAAGEQGGFYWRGSSAMQRDGTVLRNGLGASVMQGSLVVTAFTETTWNSLNIVPGSVFSINNTACTVSSVDSGTQITLSAPYTGVSTTNARYTITKPETVLVTTGSQTVAGFGTLWTATTATAGDYFRVNSDGTWYRIQKVNSDTSMTLGSSATATTAYAGSTVTEPYTIIRGSRVDWLTKAGPAPFAVPDTDTTGDVSGKNNMGVAFNLYLLENDPAAYVHNRYYVKRLIYDSIDWIDDNEMNYSTGSTLTAICSGGSVPAWCAGAKTYILPNSVIPYSPAERP